MVHVVYLVVLGMQPSQAELDGIHLLPYGSTHLQYIQYIRSPVPRYEARRVCQMACTPDVLGDVLDVCS